MSGRHIDIFDSTPQPPQPAHPPQPGRGTLPNPITSALSQANPYLRVYFACANQYVRVHRRADVNQYLARCPSCGNTKSFLVGSQGTDRRFFQLSCR